MAPLVNRIIGAVRPDAQAGGTCVVCRGSIDGHDESVSLSGGGRVHADCATYRMRQRDGRGRQRPHPPHATLTGD